MNPTALESLPTMLLASLGQAAFVAVYLLLLAGIVWMPKTLRQPGPPVPWWKNLRFWAALICGVQVLVYGLLG